MANAETVAIHVPQERKYQSVTLESGSRFEAEVRKLIAQIKPKRIVETGTYLGQGSTTIIHNSLQAAGVENFLFYTIECNPDFFVKAQIYFRKMNMKVRGLNGLTLPRSELLTREQIRREFIEQADTQGGKIYYDHNEAEREELYFKETDFRVPDDLLKQVLRGFDYQPNLVMLDSAGHMGFKEFNYLLTLLKGECHLILDDINHCKHERSYAIIKNDPRFRVLVQSDEKFGFCICHYKPVGFSDSRVPLIPVEITIPTEKPVSEASLEQPIQALEQTGAKLLVMKPDAIGDYVLLTGFMESLKLRFPHAEMTLMCLDKTATLAERSPVWSRVIPWDRQGSAEYLGEMLGALAGEQWDVLLYPVFSRESWVDQWIEKIPATYKVGMSGDICNQSEADRVKGNYSYSHSWSGWENEKFEIDRLKRLAEAFGAATDNFEPVIDLSPLDVEEAEVYAQQYPQAIVLAPFTGQHYRQWPLENYAEVVKKIRMVSEAPIVIAGTASDNNSAFRLIQLAGVKNIASLCGKMSLPVFVAFLERSKLLIGGESSPAHLAAAAGVANVVLMGGGHWGRFMPWNATSSIVNHKLDCYHCNWRCSRSSVECIQDISVNSVWQAVEKIIVPQKELPVMHSGLALA